MGASKRISAAKAAILDLLVDAYQHRDRVGLVAFRGESAEVVLAPTASVELANLKLRNLPTGGSTPLAHGILRALELLQNEQRRQPDTVPWLVLVTDGRGNVGFEGRLGSEDAKVAAARVAKAGVNAIVIDTTAGSGSGGAAREIARLANADYVRVGDPSAETLAAVIRERM
jgi:magnesium chelatase subunit D